MPYGDQILWPDHVVQNTWGAEFHPEFGIPMKYQRIEMRTGAHDALRWEVTRFEQRK